MDRVSMVLDIKSIEKGDKRVVCQSELRICVKREVGWALMPVPFSPPPHSSLSIWLRFLRTQSTMKRKRMSIRAQELCEEGGGLGCHSPSHSAPIPSKPHGFCGCCKAPRKKKAEVQSSGAV